MNGQLLGSSLGSAFRASVIVLTLVMIAVLWIVVGPKAGGVPILVAATVALAWVMLNQTVPMLGVLLAIMSVHSLFILLGQFYELPGMTAISAATKEIPLVLLTLILWRRNGLKLSSPDWFLVTFFTISLIRSSFDGGIRGFIDDFGFLIPYTAGRVTVLSEAQERLWGKCAVWIGGALSVLGLVEVFVIGDAPRRVLYAAVTGGDGLPDSFHAGGFEGIREASTMTGPLTFAALCMVGLIIWWVYLRNPIPAGMLFAGLVCTLTRSAWLGTAVALTVLAFREGERRRLAYYSLLGVIVFALAIPTLGIRDYLSGTRTGQDESEQVHSASLLAGLDYVRSHPFGSGAETVGPRIMQQNSVAFHIESSYLILAAQYGVLAGLCFVGFLWAGIEKTWRTQTPLGDVAAAILMGFGIMMFFLPMHLDFRLACWVWFPVGLAIRGSAGQGSAASGQAETHREELA